MTVKQKWRTERIAAEHLEAGDVIVLPDDTTYRVQRVQLGLHVVRITSEAGHTTEHGVRVPRSFHVRRTTMFVRRARA